MLFNRILDRYEACVRDPGASSTLAAPVSMLEQRLKAALGRDSALCLDEEGCDGGRGVLAFNVSLWHEHATTFIEQEEYKVTAIKDGPDFSLAITLGEGRVCAPCIEKVLQAFREHLTSSPS